MKQHTKLTQREQEQHTAEQHLAQQTSREFASVEEVLRYDAGQTEVPLRLTRKIQQSADNLPGSKRPWWRRLFGR